MPIIAAISVHLKDSDAKYSSISLDTSKVGLPLPKHESNECDMGKGKGCCAVDLYSSHFFTILL